MQSSELLPEWLRAHTVKQRPNHKHDKHPPPPRPSPPPPLKVRMEPEAVVYSRNKVVTGFDDCSAILMQRLPLISSDQLHVTGSAATACKMAPRGMWRVPSLLHEADLILAHLSLSVYVTQIQCRLAGSSLPTPPHRSTCFHFHLEKTSARSSLTPLLLASNSSSLKLHTRVRGQNSGPNYVEIDLKTSVFCTESA